MKKEQENREYSLWIHELLSNEWLSNERLSNEQLSKAKIRSFFETHKTRNYYRIYIFIESRYTGPQKPNPGPKTQKPRTWTQNLDPELGFVVQDFKFPILTWLSP